jgi:hypothetical protein
VRLEVLMEVKMSVLFIWVVTLHLLVGRYECFRETLSASPGLKMETVYFSETLVSTYESMWCYNPKEQREQILS